MILVCADRSYKEEDNDEGVKHFGDAESLGNLCLGRLTS